ncbi:hypothetical protein [Rhizobium sp. NPDC090279]|uniref:hypothetical protein n=1 Tax=Rhizobium sp. NPDC090279 TaxID=3364499 RepID=UPI00383BF478
MSTHANSLKKQIELLQGEIEIYSNAVDRLAAQLAEKEAQLRAVAPSAAVDAPVVVPADQPAQEMGEMVQ